MDRIFSVQLATSFILGGGIVAALSLFAERAPSHMAGVLLSLPSTQAVSLFFLGIVLSPQAVGEAFTGVPAALGGSVLFVCVYAATAFLPLPKVLSMFLSGMLGLAAWFASALLLNSFVTMTVFYSLLVYCILVAASHYVLWYVLPHTQQPIILLYTPAQKLVRAIIAGSVIAVVVLVSKLIGPYWGGIASIFPAAYFVTSEIVHYHHSPQSLVRVMSAIPLASPIFIFYAWVAAWSFPAFGVVGGTVTAYGVSLMYYAGALSLAKKFH